MLQFQFLPRIFKKSPEQKKDSFMMKFICSSVVISFLIIPSITFAGGISLGATRVIYPAENKQASLSINNSDKKNRYLIQSWVEDDKGNKTNDFIITPPLFVSNPQTENKLRIIFTQSKENDNKETLYWLNSKAIPSIDKKDIEGKNVLQLAVLSRIKLIVRPTKLAYGPEKATEHLSISKSNGRLLVSNSSPYYITMVNIYHGNSRLENTMVSPGETVSIATPNNASGDVRLQTINDYGAKTPVINIPVS